MCLGTREPLDMIVSQITYFNVVHSLCSALMSASVVSSQIAHCCHALIRSDIIIIIFPPTLLLRLVLLF